MLCKYDVESVVDSEVSALRPRLLQKRPDLNAAERRDVQRTERRRGLRRVDDPAEFRSSEYGRDLDEIMLGNPPLCSRLQLVQDAATARGVEQKVRPGSRVENVGCHSDSARTSASNCTVELGKTEDLIPRRPTNHSSMLISNSSEMATTTGSIS